MIRAGSPICTLATLMLLASPAVAQTSETLQARAAKALSLLAGAESRFQPPSKQWFHDTQAALRQNVAEVGAAFDAMDPQAAQEWKAHLRWHLLEPNLQSTSVNLADLELVRRWMYSNRKGLEGPLFANLRTNMDEFLDAATTFSYPDLEGAYVEHVALARKQIRALADDPSDSNAVTLGETLGWLERTGQLAEELPQIRQLLSLPNTQIRVSTVFVQRVLQLFETEIEQTIPLTSTEVAPPAGLLRRERTLHIRGTAHSKGSTTLEVIANPDEAEISLVFQGRVVANCRADAGPAVLNVRTAGPVEAFKPIFLSTEGLRVGEAQVNAEVRTNLQSISARRNFVKLIAQRRANEPEARAHMHTSAHGRTTELLAENLNERVDEGIAEIRAEIDRIQSAMSGFSEVLAPAAREGAVPRLEGLRSSPSGIEVNVAGARRHQFGTPLPYGEDILGGDVQLRVHVSMFNNTAETILGGKSLSDEFLMKYAQVLQAQLPLPLMVHSRAPRWSITTFKQRPLELRVPSPNRLEFVMRIQKVEVDGQLYDAPAIATMRYELVKNQFDEYALVRDGQVELETNLPTAASAFLLEKLDAFFAPVLDAGGVAIPDGGVLGLLNGVQPVGVRAEAGWITIGVNVPEEVLKAMMNYQRDEESDRSTWYYGPGLRDTLVSNLQAVSAFQLGLNCVTLL